MLNAALTVGYIEDAFISLEPIDYVSDYCRLKGSGYKFE
jgi:hypothetical protein